LLLQVTGNEMTEAGLRSICCRDSRVVQQRRIRPSEF